MSDPDLPVLLVHGYLCPKSAMLPLQGKLQSRGFQAHLVDLSPLCIQDIRLLSAQLAGNVDRVLSESNAGFRGIEMSVSLDNDMGSVHGVSTGTIVR